MNKEISISFCITCMGRLHDLRKTLPANISLCSSDRYEFTLVNYDSKDGLDEWVKENYQDLIDSGKIKYLYSKGHKYFRMSEAKNLAHGLATKGIVCNLDADNFISTEFLGYLDAVYTKKPLSVVYNGRQGGNGGRVVLPRKTFEELGGYDIAYNDYGHFEHKDLVDRCEKLGLNMVVVPNEIMPFIKQTNEVRFGNYKDGKKTILNRNFKLYKKGING